MITFLGDVALLPNKYKLDYIPQTPFIFNLEYVIGNENCLSPALNKINLISTDDNFEAYFGHKPVAVTISNNHILDYGTQGLDSTKLALNNKSIGIIEANLFWYKNICMISYSCIDNNIDFYPFCFSKDKCEKDIQLAKKNGAERIIVFMHWGIENQYTPTKNQIDIGHWLIDQGVSIVIGNHPHCVQPIEKYRDHFICYSLGNCLFPDHNLDSHFDCDGVSHRRWHTKWCWWNNKSIGVVYNENTNDIEKVECLYTDNNGIHKENETTITSFKLKKENRITYILKKYVLFFHSNLFVEGKLLDFQAIKNEILRKIKE